MTKNMYTILCSSMNYLDPTQILQILLLLELIKSNVVHLTDVVIYRVSMSLKSVTDFTPHLIAFLSLSLSLYAKANQAEIASVLRKKRKV